MKSQLTREEVLAHLTTTSLPWGQISVVNDWTFQDGQYIHTIHDPISLDDVNRAKIKPNAKVRILSPRHSEYVQKLAFEVGFSWYGASHKISYTDKQKILFDIDMHLVYGDLVDHPAKEIFIDLPRGGEPAEPAEADKWIPEVGQECEYLFGDESIEGRIEAVCDDAIWFKKKDGIFKTFVGTHKFRPLKTDREVLFYDCVDALKQWGGIHSMNDDHKAAILGLIDAGLIKRDMSQNENSN